MGVIGGGGGMQPGVTLQISLYYRDASGLQVTVASTSITNSVELFHTNTHFVDFGAHLRTVQETDPWAGQHIGIQLLSTTGFDLAGGYWDLDNVRLTETPAPLLRSPSVRNSSAPSGQFSFTVLSQPGLGFEVQATTNLDGVSSNWISIGTFTNLTGVMSFTDTATNFNQRYYRARQL